MKLSTLRLALFWAILFLIHSSLTYSQVTTLEYFPNGDKEITIIFDVKLAKDGRAAGLLGRTNDVFMWSGAGTTDNGNAFEYQPPGQTNFNVPYEPGRMTSLGNDRWSIKIKPRDYFRVPANQPIKRLGLLLKNANGSAQTEDFFLKMYDGGFNMFVAEPNLNKIFNRGDKIKIRAFVSKKADNITADLNGIKRTVSNTDSLSIETTIPEDVINPYSIKITATSGNETINETINIVVKPTVTIKDLPNSTIKDGINYISDNSVILSLVAPKKEFVYVIGEFNNWKIDDKFLMNRTTSGDRYWIQIDNLVKGQEYAFQYLVDGSVAVADPFTEKTLDPNFDREIPASTYPNLKAYPRENPYGGVVSVLQTAQTPYNWKVKNFVRPAKEKLVIYELLIRDFIASRKYRDVADSLGHLKRLGINALQLMPINEFSANNSWGYNPIFYTAPDKAYGTKDDLKYLIDKCHENGIAVILDVVFNHADREFSYVKMYWDGAPSKDSPYFNVKATHPFSVFFDFNHESKYVQDYMDKCLEFWTKEYKIDGYRFDLSKGFTQTLTDPNVGLWGNYDLSRIKLLKRMYDKIRTYDKDSYLILEHFADNSEEIELANYGFMLWGNMNGAFRNIAKGVGDKLDWLSYQRRGWNNPNLVGYMESHDEERMMFDILRNGKNGEQTVRELPQAIERVKASAALFFAYPGPKMIWQFGEFGYDVSIDENGRVGIKPLKWEYMKDPARLKMYKTFAELIKLKTTQAAFNSTNFNENSAEMVKKINITHTSMDVHIIANMDVNTRVANFNFTKTGKWYDYFTGKEIEVTDINGKINLQPSEFHIYTTVKLPTPEAGLVPWMGDAGFVLNNEPNAQTFDYQAFPNPTTDKLTLKLGFGESEVIVEDLTGRRHFISTVSADEFTLDLANYPAGVYLVKTIQNGRTKTKRIVKK